MNQVIEHNPETEGLEQIDHPGLVQEENDDVDRSQGSRATPVHFTNKSASLLLSTQHGATQSMAPNGFSYPGSPATCHGSQQPMGPRKQPCLAPDLERQQKLLAQIDEKRKQLENARRLHEQSQNRARRVSSSYGLAQSLPGKPPPFSMGPLSYPRALEGGYEPRVSSYNHSNYQFQMQAPGPCGEIGSSFSPASFLAPGYNIQREHPMPPGLNKRLPGPYHAPVPPATQGQVLGKVDYDNKGTSDDDEPLRTRVKRHPSMTSQGSVISVSSPPRPSTHGARPTQREDSSDIEFVSSTPKTKALAVTNSIRPLPQPAPPSPHINTTDSTAPSRSDHTEIDWKLPRFDVQLQPAQKAQDTPSVKISLPNLVREELLLSPDHAAMEIHLLLTVFLPSQRALPTPDPAPAAAVLNFHNIALMVIEAFVQYEIGDEMGTGRGHWHASHDNDGEQDYARSRSARDADVQEIFFAVVDRWRAGVVSGKKSLEVLRGPQEFCDVALDVIYWIKENGLLGSGDKEEENEEEEEEEEHGTRTVPEGVSVAKISPKAKVKRATLDKPKPTNHVQPRKKAKMQANEANKKTKTKTKTKMKKRGPARTPGITIVRRS